MSKTRFAFTYITADAVASLLAWTLFFVYPNKVADTVNDPLFVFSSLPLLFSIAIVPLYWIIINFISGYYTNFYQKSRYDELIQLALLSITGVALLFLIIANRCQVALPVLMIQLVTFAILHFISCFSFRSALHIITQKHLKSNTLIIGGGCSSLQTDQLINHILNRQNIVGFLSTSDMNWDEPIGSLRRLGTLTELDKIISKYHIEEIILAFPTIQKNVLLHTIKELYNHEVLIHILPQSYSTVKKSVDVVQNPNSELLNIPNMIMPIWKMNIKRVIDVVISSLLIVLLVPMALLLAFIIGVTSSGGIIIRQERLGYRGEPFVLYKFRSMYVDAEKNGPTLSYQNDPRVTPIGRFMRKLHLDETPQLLNVLRGDMSLIGPRPERQFFAEQLSAKLQDYSQIQRLRPGVTSLSQIKYGYASNLNQMVERFEYDNYYIKNASLWLDAKIFFRTAIKCLSATGV